MDKRVVIKEITINALQNRKRKVRIILPKDYEKSKKSYPVLYMHDGQNLIGKSPFSGYSWDVLKTLDEMHDLTKGIIIVGIDNGEIKRVLEYSPYIPKKFNRFLNKKHNIPYDEIKPEADLYGQFIVNQLKPYIDKEYRTKPDVLNTFIAGSSCGGVISIYLGFKYQEIFSVIGSFSAAFSFIGKSIADYVDNLDINSRVRIYHDMGTREAGIKSIFYTWDTKKFNKHLLLKIPNSRTKMIIDEKGKHSEYYWAIRFKEFIKFIYKNA